VKVVRQIDWRRWPWDFRKFMGWLFAADCVVKVVISARAIPSLSYEYFAMPFLQRVLTYPIFSVEVAVVEGVAWWTIWRGKRWATVFGIAASLMYFLMFSRQFIIPLPPVPGRHIGTLFVGIIGLVAFISRGKYPSDKSFFEWVHERNAPGSLFGKR
jgi:hypothetical protein